MKALVYRGPGRLAFEDVPVPEIADGEVLVRTRAVGICGSDLHAYQHETPRRVPPIVMGHEASGVVEAVGSAVVDLEPGDRVVPHPVVHCGDCPFCRRGLTQLCARRDVLGVTCAGCYAEYFKTRAHAVYKIDDTLSHETAAMAEPFSVGLHAVELATDDAPASALVIGAGTIGLMALTHARLAGVGTVYVEDLNRDRLALARKLGGTVGSGPDRVRDIDVVFEAVGVAPTFTRALDAVRTGGHVVLLGMSQPEVGMDLLAVVSRELRISGSYIFGAANMKKALGLLSPELDDLVGLVRPFEQAVSVFETLSRDQGIVKALLTF